MRMNCAGFNLEREMPQNGDFAIALIQDYHFPSDLPPGAQRAEVVVVDPSFRKRFCRLYSSQSSLMSAR